MDRQALQLLLKKVAAGEQSVSTALDDLRDFPVAQIEGATLDTHRALRRGFPEVVLAEGKSDSHLFGIVTQLLKGQGDIVVTRIPAERAERLLAACPDPAGAVFESPNLLVYRRRTFKNVGRGPIAVICAGTSDLPVADEAAMISELMGNEVVRVTDVGVAGLHRLMAHLPTLMAAKVIIVCAGMEGALPSVVAGLVAAPVIAVPTSVGYGVSAGGFAALLTMLGSCAAGITVVNIDNGFGAGYAASLMNRRDDE
ncbi:MAG: NCAIR mutase (PurE)-related protein [Myxococcota bacterium]|jgi:NCAIR mutase (PurE)-related protein